LNLNVHLLLIFVVVVSIDLLIY